jgi:hypothetical protein
MFLHRSDFLLLTPEELSKTLNISADLKKKIGAMNVLKVTVFYKYFGSLYTVFFYYISCTYATLQRAAHGTVLF